MGKLNVKKLQKEMVKETSTKYWEVETPVELKGEKSVARVYTENGKVQVFPVVKNSRHGIGRGATLDLENMTVDELQDLRELLTKAIDFQLHKKGDEQ